MEEIEHIQVGGIRTARITRRRLAEQMVIDSELAAAGLLEQPKISTSSNGHVIALYHSDAGFRRLIDQADLVDADGMPLIHASRLLSRAPLPERVATTDFIHDACYAAARNGVRFFFLGGKPGVADLAAAMLRRQYPALQIVGCRHGYFAEAEESSICAEIVQSGADVLWLGLGSPLQERFAVSNRSRLTGLSWIRTCGGMFDHITGAVVRAPLWMQRAGLEWLHRAAYEPRRLGLRYLKTNPVAAFHLLTKTGPVQDQPGGGDA